MELVVRRILLSGRHKSINVYPRSFSTTACVGLRKVNVYNMNFDRRIKVDYKESMKYMDSEAYEKTYKGSLVWKAYRRYFKGQFPSENTRLSCINDHGFVDTSYPCPICRDEYLVLHHENVKLIEQFIDPNTGSIYTCADHGLCQRQYRALLISIHRARDLGLMLVDVPERYYDYKEYCSH